MTGQAEEVLTGAGGSEAAARTGPGAGAGVLTSGTMLAVRLEAEENTLVLEMDTGAPAGDVMRTGTVTGACAGACICKALSPGSPREKSVVVDIARLQVYLMLGEGLQLIMCGICICKACTGARLRRGCRPQLAALARGARHLMYEAGAQGKGLHGML